LLINPQLTTGSFPVPAVFRLFLLLIQAGSSLISLMVDKSERSTGDDDDNEMITQLQILIQQSKEKV
jgi:hypothetical protein